MNDFDLSNTIVNPVVPVPVQAKAIKAQLCPKCGREVKSLRCQPLREPAARLAGRAIRRRRQETSQDGWKPCGHG